ncbi:MAG: hypothetical protein ACMUIG_10235 [Thermoplasmatota archaeon]
MGSLPFFYSKHIGISDPAGNIREWKSIIVLYAGGEEKRFYNNIILKFRKARTE